MPWYRNFGKIETPLTEADFELGMNQGHFVNAKHRSLCILYRYTGIRKTEALRLKRENFNLMADRIMVDIGERLKHSKRTPSLPIYLNQPFVSELEHIISRTPKGRLIFPYCPKTAYNIVRRAFKYPHLFRLSLITWFFSPHPEIGRPQGFSIAEVRSWTGLSLRALDYYVGLVAIDQMGKITTSS